MGSKTQSDETDQFTAPSQIDEELPPKPDALVEAFEALREAGYVTIEGETCCSGCANHEAYNYAQELADDGVDVTGSATYHVQNLEGWQSRGYVYLGYGSAPNDSMDTEDAGHEICEILAEHNIETEWDGNPGTKIKAIL